MQNEKNTTSESHICFICETPLQALNCLKIICQEEANGSVDLYLQKKMNNVNTFEELFLKTKVVKKIIKFKYPKTDLEKIHSAIRIAFPNHYLKRTLKGNTSLSNKYDVIYYASLTRFVRAMIIMNVHAKTILFEDGLSSYERRTTLCKINWKEEFLHKLLGRDISRFRTSVIYLNNPSLCQIEWIKEKREIKNTQAFKSLLSNETLFRIPDVYGKSKFIYLSQPMREKTGNDSEYDSLLSELSKREVIYRAHPSEKESNCWALTDSSQIPWEIICEKTISDSNILIGKCSTAQIQPKWFYGKEPTIIFTYLMANDYFSKINRKANEETMEKTKKIYKNPKKIYSVKSTQELIEILDKISGE